MEGEGGCLIEYGRCDGTSKMDQIMQRFRPIAPKPVPGPGPGPCSPSSSAIGKRGRSERRSCNARRRKVTSRSTATFPILPQPPVLVVSPSRKGYSTGTLNPEGRVVVGSWVTVEGVGDVWGGSPFAAVFLRRSDEERKSALAVDSCPGFLSDGCGRVVWTNDSYRRMACGEEEEARGGVVSVWLANQEAAAAVASTMENFTCKVRVDFVRAAIGKSEAVHKRPVTAPCDVWRMDCGDLAWRLDVDATLRLGR